MRIINIYKHSYPNNKLHFHLNAICCHLLVRNPICFFKRSTRNEEMAFIYTVQRYCLLLIGKR